MTNKLACAALLAAAATAFSCGGDDDSAPPVDAAVQIQCDPVDQTGCDEGEKCAQLVVSEGPPFLGRVECVPNGTVAVGEACTNGEPGDETGFDDCQAGGQCINGLCRTICKSLPDSCVDGFSCSLFEDFFDDIEEYEAGVCSQVCDPVRQDCAIEGEGCYLNIFDREGQGTCVSVVEDSLEVTQNEVCVGPDDSACYLNGCAPGYWAMVPTFLVQPSKGVCSAFCEPVDTYIVDPDGDGKGELVKGANAEGLPIDEDKDPKTPAISCNVDYVGVAGQQCRFMQVLRFTDLTLEYIPIEYGFCADTGPGAVSLELWGDCAQHSEERLIRIFDEAEEEEPNSGSDAVEAFCTKNPAACAVACFRLETLEAIYDAYCKTGPHPDGATCTQPAARARYVDVQRRRAERAMRSLTP